MGEFIDDHRDEYGVEPICSVLLAMTRQMSLGLGPLNVRILLTGYTWLSMRSGAL